MGDPYTRVHATLDGIVELVRSAKAMPLSASCVLNRGELLSMLDELRAVLPPEVGDAGRIVAAGQLEAERVIAGARGERARLLADTTSGRSAEDAAARIVADAQETAVALRRDIDAYVDTKLANFEVVLGRALDSVARGRAKLAGRTDFAALVTDDLVGEDAAGPAPNAPQQYQPEEHFRPAPEPSYPEEDGPHRPPEQLLAPGEVVVDQVVVDEVVVDQVLVDQAVVDATVPEEPAVHEEPLVPPEPFVPAEPAVHEEPAVPAEPTVPEPVVPDEPGPDAVPEPPAATDPAPSAADRT